MYYEKTYEIDTRDLDCFGFCRASAILGYLQDTAGLAAGQFGATNDQMVRDHGHCWMVTRTAYELEKPLVWRDKLTVKTWHRGGDKPLMLRDFDLAVNGKPLGQALSIWALVNLGDHTITRADRFPQFAGTDGGALIRDTKLPRLRLPAALVPAGERELHYSDTDQNGHVNNTRYADYLCDAAQLQRQALESFVKALHIDYLKECKAGEVLSLLSAQAGGSFYIQGKDAQGEARFQGSLTLG